MTVFVLVGVDAYIYGVFDDEEKACNYGNTHFPGRAWDIVEREVR